MGVSVTLPENGCVTVKFSVDQSWITSIVLTATAGVVPCAYARTNCTPDSDGALPPELGVGQRLDVISSCPITFQFLGSSSDSVTLNWHT